MDYGSESFYHIGGRVARLGVVSKTLGFLPSGMTVSIEALRPEGGVSKTDVFVPSCGTEDKGYGTQRRLYETRVLTEWGSGGRRFESSRPDQSLQGVKE